MAESLGLQTQAGTAEPPWVDEVLHFWFAELGEGHWFTKDEQLDTQIRRRFLGLHERLLRQEIAGASAPRPTLAAVIVLDQFSRNMFRGSPRAYAADASARRLARTATEVGLDLSMTPVQRLFLYLPFEHSEDREDQALAFRLINRLGNETWTRDALAHKVLIDRFGRFPHRNQILNRLSTADEIAHLAESTTSF
jgi:uncharacterized protein (DUF924 family)